jgi:predicted permease
MDKPGIRLQDGSRGGLMLRQMLAMPFIAMTAVVGLVLLIACANLAGLLVARGTARQHEMAVRVAVGAGRWQLIRQSLTESLVLALLGGCVGFVVAGFGKQFLRGFLVMMPDEFTFDLSMDTRVLVFALGLSVLTALVFGLIPAVLAARIDPLKGLKSRSSMNRTRLRVGRVLVAAQVGLSVLLIVSAGLMVRSVSKLTRLDPGYDSENVLLFKLNPGQAEYKKQQLIRFYDQVQESLTKIPGVRSVACSSLVLASGSHSSTSFTLPGRQKQPDEQWHTATMSVSEDYFKTMSIPLNHGRSFNITDTPDTEPVVVVNETFAQQFYPDNATPLDQIVRIDDGTKRAFRIVGVSRDTTYDSLSSEIPPLVHLSQRQRVQGRTSIAVRSSLSPLSLVTTIRQAIGRIDSQIPMTHIITQTEQNERSIAAHRLFAGLGGFLAGLALLLSCIGLYCIIAYNMAQRTQEIGVRMALGATPAHVARPILREALLLTTIGLAIGLPLALGVAQIIKSQLYGVAPTDPVTIGAVCFTLISVALLAAWLPARRAAKIDPMEALRYE